MKFLTLKPSIRVWLYRSGLLSIQVFVAVTLFLSGCKVAKPVAPTAAYQAPVEKVRQATTLNLPIEIPVSDLEKQINAQVAPLIYEDNSLTDNGGDNFMIKIIKRAPIKIEPKANYFNFTVPVNIWAKAGYAVEKLGIKLEKYEDTDFSIDIKFTTKIDVDNNWVVRTFTASNGYNWVTKPVLQIGGFSIPITTIVDKIVASQLSDVAKTIDAQVKGKINLKPYVTQAWDMLQDPILINKDYKAWLYIEPKTLSLAPFSTNGKNLKTVVGLTGYTLTTIGEKPSLVKSTIIPNLVLDNKLQDGFSVALTANIPYAEAKHLAEAQVLNKTFDFDNGKKKVTITALDIYAQNDKMVVALDMLGSFTGKVFLKGKPYFDAKTNSLKISDLDFDLDTKNKLVKAANWIAHGKFLETMQPYFVVPVDAQLQDAKKLITQNLANNKVHDNITINGKLDSFSPSDITLTPTGIQAIIIGKGKIDVLLQGF